MVRIKDIAKEAKVSEGTVDRVLHNRGGVSKTTEARIKKIISDKKFSINPVASALAMKNKYTITVLMPEFSEEDAFWKSPYLGILKATNELQNLGVTVHIIHFNQYKAQSYEQASQKVYKTNPTAVLLVPLFRKETNQFVQELDKLDIPYAFLNVNMDGFNNLFFIGQDSYTAGYLAGKLSALSLKPQSKILLIQTRDNIDNNTTISKRIEGFTSYFKDVYSKAPSIILKIENLDDKKGTEQSIRTQLSNTPAIEGIFVPSSRASAIVTSLPKTVIEKLSIIGFDTTPQNTQCLKEGTIPFLISQKTFDQGA